MNCIQFRLSFQDFRNIVTMKLKTDAKGGGSDVRKHRERLPFHMVLYVVRWGEDSIFRRIFTGK